VWQRVPSQAKSPQRTALGCSQAPWPSQWASGVALPKAQKAGAQKTGAPGIAQPVRLVPSH